MSAFVSYPSLGNIATASGPGCKDRAPPRKGDYSFQTRSRIGCSRASRKACIQWAAVAPSIGRWSTETVTRITDRGRTLPFLVTTGSRRTAPTATIDDCGGLMIAANSSVPYMPRLVTVEDPPSSLVLVEPPLPGSFGEVMCRGRQHAYRHALDGAEHRRHQAGRRRHRSADVNGRHLSHVVSRPDDVHRRHRHVGACRCLDHEVVDRDPDG